MSSTSTGSGAATRPNTTDAHSKGEKHVHHGQTMAAWVGSLTAMVAFFVGGIALVVKSWPMFGVGVGLLVVAAVAGLVLQKMGHGAY